MIFLGTLDRNRCNFEFEDEVLKVSKRAMTIMKGQKLPRNIYRLLGTIVVGGATIVESELGNTILWHMRLGHMSECEMTDLHKENLLKGVKTYKLDFCRHCVLGKQNKMQFKTTIHKIKRILDHVHTDV